MPNIKLERIGKTKDGYRVFINPSNSHIQTHQAVTPNLKDLITEALSLVVAKDRNDQVEVNLPRIIGTTDLVETSSNDSVIYAKRKKRKIYSRFVKNRTPVETSCITLVLQKINKGYELYSTWLGQSVPPFPGDRREWPNSKTFWEDHALVFGNQELQEDTITDICPW
jgi:hypothetical protein